MIPQISGAITDAIPVRVYPSFDWRLSDNQISGNVEGIEAIQQAVYHILMTERYAYPIYDDNYGVELEQYKGRSFAFLQATIQDTLQDALLQDDRITGVTVTNVTNVKKDSALVEFTVTCNRGRIGMAVEVNV